MVGPTITAGPAGVWPWGAGGSLKIYCTNVTQLSLTSVSFLGRLKEQGRVPIVSVLLLVVKGATGD
jgi:hypothetical protein